MQDASRRLQEFASRSETRVHGWNETTGSKEAGRKLKAMLELGASKPWPDALAVMTGERQLDATAIVDYFAPLKVWLDEQNKGKPVGW